MHKKSDSSLEKAAYNFCGQQVWVTGAAGGIGYAVAENFQRLGATVLGFDCDFGARSYPFETCQLDITDADAVALLVQEKLCAQQGPQVLVNAAGTLRLGSLDGNTQQGLSIEDWRACFDVNVSGVFYLLRELVAHFKARPGSAIVNVASNAARVPRTQMGAYCASKAALQSLSHCVGLELAEHGVRCNLVSPGSTDTPMLAGMLADKNGDCKEGYLRTIAGFPEQYKLGIPLKKIATAQEVANTVIFLASDLASHITLQNIVVDGGATLAA